LISQNVQTISFINHGGFPLWAGINSICCSLTAPGVPYMVHSPPIASIWIFSHPTSRCYLLFLLAILRTILQRASWVIWLVAPLAALWWINFCLHYGGVPRISVFVVEPANLLVFNTLSPGWGGCVSMIYWGGIGEKDDNERKWEALRTI
jgi:hypothetical protein